MKLSLKFEGPDDQRQHPTHLMTAKVPITIFNHPFISSIAASSSAATTNSGSEFTFSLSTNFPSGPSLKLSYFPTTTSSLPFSLSLKSGLGLLGNPRSSPLVFSTNFTLSPSFTPVPSFFLHFKPQFGHFSLNKTVFSAPNFAPPTNPNPYSAATASLDNNSSSNGEIGKRFVPDGSSSCWQELKLEPCGGGIGFAPSPERSSLVEKNDEKRGVSPGVAVMARTVMPVTKGLLLNLRWGLNLPGDDSGVKMPYLTVNKIGLERVEEAKQKQSNKKKQGTENSERDLQLLKGMCFWMKRDMELVENENREMKRMLDEMKMGVSTAARNSWEGSNGGGGRRVLSPSQHYSGESSGEFEWWRSKKGSGGREENNNEKKEKEGRKQHQSGGASDVESELQKAIKAATSS